MFYINPYTPLHSIYLHVSIYLSIVLIKNFPLGFKDLDSDLQIHFRIGYNSFKMEEGG